MDIDYILEVIEKNDLSIAIQQSSWAFQTLETIHVFAFALVVGTILAVDLRLLGLSSRKSRVTEMIEDCLQWTWLGFILAFITGFMMFMTKSAIYFEAATFRWKMALLLLAGLNMLIFHFRTFQSFGSAVSRWPIDYTLGCNYCFGSMDWFCHCRYLKLSSILFDIFILSIRPYLRLIKLIALVP